MSIKSDIETYLKQEKRIKWYTHQITDFDFLSVNTSGRPVALICRETSKRAFPFTKIEDFQLESLERFHRAPKTKSYIILNFNFGEDSKETTSCFALKSKEFIKLKEKMDAIPVDHCFQRNLQLKKINIEGKQVWNIRRLVI